MINVQASVSKGWLHKHGGFVFNDRYYMDPFYRMKQDEECHAFIKKKFPDLYGNIRKNKAIRLWQKMRYLSILKR